MPATNVLATPSLEQIFETHVPAMVAAGPGVEGSALELIAEEMPQLPAKAYFVIDDLLEEGCPERLRALEEDPMQNLLDDPVINFFLALSRYGIPSTTGPTAHIRTLSGGLPLHVDDESGNVLVHTMSLPAQGYRHLILPHVLPPDAPDSFLLGRQDGSGCVSRADLERPEAVDMRVNRAIMMAGNAQRNTVRRISLPSGVVTDRKKYWGSAPHGVAAGSQLVAIGKELPEYDRERLMVYAH